MSSAVSSKSRSLKRLSLLQSPTSLSSPSSFAFDSPVVASKHVALKLVHSGELNDACTSVHPSPTSSTSSPSSGHGGNASSRKTSRRQSSIYYVSQDRESDHALKDVRAPADERRTSTLHDHPPKEDVSTEVKAKQQSVAGNDEQATPATLADKHADLLRFIAQKESRCLELRSQLAIEEAELLALKRKWERIVSRQIKRESSTSFSSLDAESSAHNNMLSGFKEGVHGVGRLLAHLSENIGAQNGDADVGHASNSSISTMTTNSSSSTRLSQSSMSSLGTVEDHVYPDQANANSDARNSSTKRHSLSTAIRRKPYEPSSPSTPSSSVVTPQTPQSASDMWSQPSAPTPSRTQSTDTVRSTTHAKHMKRLSAVSGSLPPASSIPGISVAPFASWVEGVGKRLVSQVTSPSTSTFNSASGPGKRTSTFFSDGANSILSSLTSPTRSTEPNSGVIDLSTPVSLSLLDDDNMLGEGAGAQWAGMATLSPERPKLAPAPMPGSRKHHSISTHSESRTRSKEGEGNTRDSDNDSEEWNW